ncbi:ABC transporter permease, partial [Streptomyces sp. t39]|uniref:ABC transporter permease n=1 Tax=Streptomyces sp. t39 TaxID=1828156 RepID=UPI00396740E4
MNSRSWKGRRKTARVTVAARANSRPVSRSGASALDGGFRSGASALDGGFGAVIALQVGSLTQQLGAQSFTGGASVLAVIQQASPLI